MNSNNEFLVILKVNLPTILCLYQYFADLEKSCLTSHAVCSVLLFKAPMGKRRKFGEGLEAAHKTTSPHIKVFWRRKTRDTRSQERGKLFHIYF